MNIFRFLDWKMYQDAKKLNRKIGGLINSFPIDVKIKYGSQTNRAALSICLNIAESAGRYSDTEMCRFFDIALGSLSETVACADNLRDEGYINNEKFNQIYEDAINIAKQIQGMQNNTHKNPRIYKRD